MASRVLALDGMRGIVMVLMTLDHASGAFNRGRLVRDAATSIRPDEVWDPLQFALRWVTHLCAPSFLFLAGAAVALSVARRVERGDTPGSIDRDLAIRGALLIGFDVVLISWLWGGGSWLLAVLYAIGGSLLFMIGLRRLPVWVGGALGLGLAFGGEALIAGALAITDGTPHWLPGALLYGGRFSNVAVAYPVWPWLGIALLGWAFGHQVLWRGRLGAARVAAVAGVASLAVFAVVRGLDGYGNLDLMRGEHTWMRWLNVSKYPPSLSYQALELGLMGLVLAGLLVVEARRTGPPRLRHPLLVYGQSALFFYLLHIPMLEALGWVTGLHHQAGITEAVGAMLIVLVALYPMCVAWRAAKQARPASWMRFI